ncbi:MAG: tetratricopeptide 2 peptide [Rickettsiales bacterium]|jgi:tetratricopeptide (TPR) repeat protein|nr:tetratricopeptide 2 peptide [Rickettsiales bacterium]
MGYRGFRKTACRILLIPVFVLVLVYVPFVLGGIMPAEAEDPGVRKQFEETFHKMMKDPSNIDTTLHYANLAIELKDYEAAIPAMERVLLFNPSLHEVRLQVGALYFNLKSFDMASTYLTEVATSKATSPEQKARANDYLNRIKQLR